MTLDDAIDWFRLDATTVNEARLKEAFRRIAKELHPDTKTNFIDKLTAHDNFVAATNAKGMIVEALRQGTLPRTAERTNDDYIYFDQDEDDNYSGYKDEDEEKDNKHESYEDTLTGRDKYDYHNPRPLERLMEMPIIGPIITLVVGCGLFLGMLAGFGLVSLLFVPFQLLALIYLLASTVLEVFGIELPIPDFKWERLWNMVEGLPLFLLYYALTFAGTKLWAWDDTEKFLYVLTPIWLTITLMALDEIYSVVRYMMVARRFKSQVAAVISEED